MLCNEQGLQPRFGVVRVFSRGEFDCLAEYTHLAADRYSLIRTATDTIPSHRLTGLRFALS